ncbi:MAG: hypothetical protein WCF81_21195 [Roseiarcus sp.]
MTPAARRVTNDLRSSSEPISPVVTVRPFRMTAEPCLRGVERMLRRAMKTDDAILDRQKP